MRSYPRRVYKSESISILVHNAEEEMRASSQGYESHWKADKIESRKGTDKEILRASEVVPVVDKVEEPAKPKRRPKAEIEVNG